MRRVKNKILCVGVSGVTYGQTVNCVNGFISAGMERNFEFLMTTDLQMEQ